jgi:hypothetical protein
MSAGKNRRAKSASPSSAGSSPDLGLGTDVRHLSPAVVMAVMVWHHQRH